MFVEDKSKHMRMVVVQLLCIATREKKEEPIEGADVILKVYRKRHIELLFK